MRYVNKKEDAGDKMIELKTENYSLKELEIILNLIIEKKQIPMNEVVKELQERTKIKRATAYRRVNLLLEKKILKVKEKEKASNKKMISLKHGSKTIVKDLFENIKKLNVLLNKIEQEGKKENEKRTDGILENTAEIKEQRWIDERPMVTGISETEKNTNSDEMPGKRMDRNRGKRETKKTTNTLENRWRKLREGKIEQKYTKKQKKILSGIL